MTDEGPRWIRLYPVPFRDLEDRQQFRKYQRIRLRVSEHRNDTRAETRRPDRESIETIGEPIPTRDGWARRRRYVEPLMAQSMCEIRSRQRREGTSLGVFRPASVDGLVIEESNVAAGRREIARAWAAQGNLLKGLGTGERQGQLQELELMPYTFKYRYRCAESGCRGHCQSIIDWEIAEFYRRVRRRQNWRERMEKRG